MNLKIKNREELDKLTLIGIAEYKKDIHAYWEVLNAIEMLKVNEVYLR